MANTIKIKRTSGTGTPAAGIAQGELVYAYDTTNSNTGYANKLLIGDYNAPLNAPIIIGGSYYTGLIDSATIEITGPAGGQTYGTGADGLATAVAFTNNSGNIDLEFNLTDTGVTAGSYGSATNIPTFTVDARGRLTAAGSVSVATTLELTGDTTASPSVVDLLTEPLNVVGTSNEIITSTSGNTITIGLPTDVTITGNLTVNGTTTTVNSETVTIDDPIFTLAGDTPPTSDDSLDRGIEFRWYDTAARLGFFGYDNSSAKFTFIPDATNTGSVMSGSAGTALFGSLELDTDLEVQYGGTGVSTFTTNGIVYGNAANALQVTVAGAWDATNSIGQLLSVNSSGVPTWTNTIDGGTY
jgi:hypothetical protein